MVWVDISFMYTELMISGNFRAHVETDVDAAAPRPRVDVTCRPTHIHIIRILVNGFFARIFVNGVSGRTPKGLHRR